MPRRNTAAGIAAALALGLAVSAALFLMRDRTGAPGTDAQGPPELRPNLPASETPGAIEGGVRSADGQPGEGATVTPFTFDSIARRGRPVATDALGKFRAYGLPPGTYAVRAEKEGWGSALATGLIVPADGLHVMQDPLVLRGGATLAVRAAADGKPVAGAQVLLQHEVSHAGRVSYAVTVGQATTGPEGGASFAALEDGDYHLKCEHPGYAIRIERFRVAGSGPVTANVTMTRKEPPVNADERGKKK